MADLIELEGVGPAIAEQLRSAGYETAEDVRSADVAELQDVHMIGESSARAILNGDGQSKGRSFSISEDDHSELLAAAREGKSERGCARAVGVSWAQLDRYLDAHPDFRSNFTRARGEGESRLITGGLHDGNVSDSMAKFLLSTSFGYVKTEKQEVEVDGTHSIESESIVELDDETKDIARKVLSERYRGDSTDE